MRECRGLAVPYATKKGVDQCPPSPPEKTRAKVWGALHLVMIEYLVVASAPVYEFN